MKIMSEAEEELNVLSDDLEYQWKRPMPRYTEKELIEIFSPSKEMITDKIRILEGEKRGWVKKVKQALRRVYSFKTDHLSHWFGEQVVKIYLLPELKECNKHLVRLKRLFSILNPELTRNTSQEVTEKARQYPIYELAKYRLLLRQCGNKYSANCPFHEDKSPSFYIYPETNTFHCFGCQENGDVIKLAMQLHGASFREAIKILQ